MNEDGILEWLSFALFFSASMLLLWSHRRNREQGSFVVFIGAACLVAALEEVSYGQRLLGFPAPILKGVEMDAPHDFLLVLKETIKDAASHPYLVSFFVILIFLFIFMIFAITFRRKIAILFQEADSLLILIAVSLVLIAQVLDLRPYIPAIVFIYDSKLEEILEASAGLTMVLFAYDRALTRKTIHSSNEH